ncbi:MAG: glycosyltransferase [Candidatus Yonathbacteria bacterium]|nr:glycosyltransferase [Candidatus Yonathbacteria bacterium]
MKVLSISLDRKVFEEGSAMRSRLLDYGRLVEEIHVIVFAKKTGKFESQSFPPNIFLYPTNTLTRIGYMLRAVNIARVMKRSGVDIDVVSSQDPFETGITAFLISRIIGAKFHLQIHTDMMSPYFKDESLVNRVRVIIAKFLIPRANAIRVVSLRIKNSLTPNTQHLIPITVLPVFVDVARIRDTPTTHSLKKKYPQFEKHILMASRLAPEKNIELAIEAMKELVQRYPKAGLIIVGDGPERSTLALKAKSQNLTTSIVFEDWQESLVSYYKTADVFLLTSNYEGYGMTVAEALASNCPVVMTNVGCAGEVVHNGKNGMVVPVGNKDALVRALMQVISGEVILKPKHLSLPTKDEYLALYRKSWEDALRR